MSDIRANTYYIPCPKCNKLHRFDSKIVDEIINCTCGFDFYAFAAGEFRIAMSKSEASCEPIVRSMRRFVVSTGRCTDIPPELYDGYDDTDYPLFEDLLDKTLEEHQLESYGTVYFTKDLLDSICDSFSSGKDVELKKKKDCIDIIELKKKNISRRLSKPASVKLCSAQETNLLFKGNGAILFKQQTK